MQDGERKLAIFLPSLAGGGAQRSMLTLAGGIAAAGSAVDLVVGTATGRFAGQVPGNVRLFDLGATRVATALPRLVGYLRRERPDVLYSALDHANVAAVSARILARSRARVFVSVRNHLSAKVRGTTSARERLLPALARRAYRFADGVVAVSEGVRDDLAAHLGLDPHRVAVLPNPVVTPQLPALARQEPGHAWFGPGQPPVVLAAGRLTPQKGFRTLLEAFARARRRHPSRLVILGEGPERRDLEALAHDLGVGDCCDLHGFAPNPFAFMRRARLFVLSSSWEGLPGVLIQAMACGTPVLATDCPSGPREILDGGRLGALVPVGDPLALADAIVEALEAPTDAAALVAGAQRYAIDTAVAAHIRYLGLRTVGPPRR